MGNPWIVSGALSGFTAVAAGAFGAHALKNVLLPDQLQVFHTGASYHLIHALALVLVGVIAERRPSRLAISGWCFLGGTILFSGSLYALALSGERWLGMITPVGGVGFLAGWIALAWAGRKTA